MKIPKNILDESHSGKGFLASVKVFGKAILVGEHSVVYGGQAIGLPLDQSSLGLRLQLSSSAGHEFWINGQQASSGLVELIDDAFRELGLEPVPVVITGVSTLRAGAGLGSSAALSVGVIKLLSELRLVGEAPLASGVVSQLANNLEKRFHGFPSGLDTSIVSQDRVILFQKGKKAEPVRGRPIVANGLDRSWQFVLVDSGLRAPTKKMVERVAPFFAQPQREERVALFDKCCSLVLSGLGTGSQELVAEGMEQAQLLLEELGVVPQGLKEIIEDCYRFGALAAKVTGAGGGGYLLAMLEAEHAEKQYRDFVNFFGADRVELVTGSLS